MCKKENFNLDAELENYAEELSLWWRKAHGHKFFVSMVWGKPLDSFPERYSFKTDVELDAFLEGVEAGNGWLDYDFRIHDKGQNQKFSPQDFDLDPEDLPKLTREDWEKYLKDNG